MLYPVTLIADSGVNQAIEAVDQFLYSAHQSGSSQRNFRWRIKQPDPRLQLALCQSPPTLEPTVGQRKTGKLSFRVSCSTPSPWSLYLFATVEQRTTTWESVVPIERDEMLTRSQLKPRDLWYTSLPGGLITSADQIVGKIARHTLQPGKAIREKSLRDALLVRKGHLLRATINTPGFTVGTQVIALEEGVRGETIKVKNAKTEKLMTAVIDATGQVTLQ